KRGPSRWISDDRIEGTMRCRQPERNHSTPEHPEGALVRQVCLVRLSQGVASEIFQWLVEDRTYEMKCSQRQELRIQQRLNHLLIPIIPPTIPDVRHVAAL